MKPLNVLIQEEAATAAALAIAMTENKKSLQALYKPLEALCERYETLFKPIQAVAESFSLAVPEIDVHNPPSSNRWGNQGLRSLTHLPNGFTQIKTDDCFRNEWDVFNAVIPTKYLGANGDALMTSDVQHIQNEISVLKAEKSVEDAAELAAAERAELSRLQSKYA